MSAQHVVSGAFAWDEACRMTLSHWLPWMMLSPFILWLSFRFPIERTGWKLCVPIHAGAGVVAVLVCVAVNEYILRPPPPPWGDSSVKSPGLSSPPPDVQKSARSDQPFSHPGSHRSPWWFGVRFNVPTYLIFVSLSHAVVYFRRSQQRERRALELEARLAQARLQALRMQIHPHFLFNTLNAISTLVHSDPHAADEMIGGLSEMLRISLDSAMDQEVPLRHELNFLNLYLQIEQARFGDRLRVEQNISLEVEGALVPTLILQPLVENAIRHGIEPKLAPGVIGISAQRVGEALRISIRDTGVGVNSSDRAEKSAQKGIGLSNTRARLQSLYPGQHHFDIHNDPASGCVVELEIPFHTELWPIPSQDTA